MKKILFLITLNCAVTTIVIAQFNARLQAQIGMCTSPDSRQGIRFSRYVINNIGGGIERRAYRNLFIKLSYQKWQTFAKAPDGYNSDGFQIKYPVPFTEKSVGTHTERNAYHMIDAAVLYRFTLKRNELFAYVGPSATFGQDDRLSSFYKPADPMYPDTQMDFDVVHTFYVGGVCELGYNRVSRNGRINYGPSVGARFYPNQFTEYNFKLNFGYNFNL